MYTTTKFQLMFQVDISKMYTLIHLPLHRQRSVAAMTKNQTEKKNLIKMAKHLEYSTM